MTKKISFIILSVAIVVTEFFVFRNKNYWERSVRIFKMNFILNQTPAGFRNRQVFDFPNQMIWTFDPIMLSR